MTSSKIRSRAADSFGVNSTPTFFINGKKMTGAPTLEEFDKAFAAAAEELSSRPECRDAAVCRLCAIAAALAGCTGEGADARQGARRLAQQAQPCQAGRRPSIRRTSIPSNETAPGPRRPARGDAKPLVRRDHAARRAARDGAGPHRRARDHRAVRLDDLPLLPPVPGRDLSAAQDGVHRHRQGALRPAREFPIGKQSGLATIALRCAPRRQVFRCSTTS